MDRDVVKEFRKMDEKYDKELNNFTVRFIHYNDYIDQEADANISREPSGY